MLSRALSTIREHGLVGKGEGVLCAVSGGPDSMAMLHALWELRGRLGVRLEVATVDHGLRPEAARETALVRERAAALGLPCAVLRVDVGAARARAHGSLQDAARIARLDALAAEAKRRRCARVALAHTADDQAETVLFRIVRGTGVRGLGGIPYRRDPFVRPLLDVRRDEVLAYLGRRSIPSVSDPSNADPRFARARIRHRLLPLLAEENPRIVEALVGLAADASDLLGGAGPAGAPEDLKLSRAAAAVVRRLRAAGGGTKRVDVRGGQLEVSYGKISFKPRAGTAAMPQAVVIDGPGIYRLTPEGVALRVSDDGQPAGERGDRAAEFDADSVARPLVLRAPRPGDRMRPRGGRGSRKLQDLLVDARVPRPERAAWPVLQAADGTILFVAGLRPSEAARPTAATRRRLFVADIRL